MIFFAFVPGQSKELALSLGIVEKTRLCFFLLLKGGSSVDDRKTSRSYNAFDSFCIHHVWGIWEYFIHVPKNLIKIS